MSAMGGVWGRGRVGTRVKCVCVSLCFVHAWGVNVGVW